VRKSTTSTAALERPDARSRALRRGIARSLAYQSSSNSSPRTPPPRRATIHPTNAITPRQSLSPPSFTANGAFASRKSASKFKFKFQILTHLLGCPSSFGASPRRSSDLPARDARTAQKSVNHSRVSRSSRRRTHHRTRAARVGRSNAVAMRRRRDASLYSPLSDFRTRSRDRSIARRISFSSFAATAATASVRARASSRGARGRPSSCAANCGRRRVVRLHYAFRFINVFNTRVTVCAAPSCLIVYHARSQPRAESPRDRATRRRARDGPVRSAHDRRTVVERWRRPFDESRRRR
jgi:hypothetical protein